MKIKSLLIGMLACSAMVACTNEDVIDNGNENKGKESYLAVNLKSAHTASRAASDTYADGTEAENAVSKVLFFFFNASDQAYLVDGTKSFIEKGIKMNANDPEDDNVEEISDEILVIEKSQTVPPQKILAILNAPEALKANASLSELQGKIEAYNGTSGAFVMSNSVYKHAATGEVVVATELAAENICASQADAVANPVDIYVERVAAKVQVTAKYGDGATSFNTGIKTAEGDEIYAVVKGWEVTNIKSQAYLLKNIDKTWTDDALGFTWNDAPYFRSYWANTTAAAWNTPKHPWTWNQVDNAATGDNNFEYYYENTDANSADVAYDEIGNVIKGSHNKSQLLVAATFVDKGGKNIQIAEWYGQKYTIPNLKIAIANAVKSQIFVKGTNGTAVSITDADIDFFQEDYDKPDNRYLSYAKLVAASESKSFVGPDGTTILTKDQVNTLLKSVRPAKIWNEGGYYYMDIKHLGKTSTTGEYGLVRNHVYDITIDGIHGLGTPVYDPEMIITPERPESDESYIAAEINVLAWRVVSQTVTLQ